MLVISPIRLFAAGESELSVFEVKDGAIISYTGTETVLDIPEMINGQIVTAIGDEAFKGSMLNADQKAYIVVIIRNIFAVVQNILQMIILFITGNFLVYLIVQIITTFGQWRMMSLLQSTTEIQNWKSFILMTL